MTEAVEIYLKFVSRYLAAVFMRGEYKTIANEIKAAQNGYKEVLPMQREPRDANVRKIEYMIRHERQIAEAVTEAKLAPRGHTGGAPSGHSFVSDPTAAQAIRNADEVSLVEIDGGGRVEWPERWLKVVSVIRAWCGHDTLRAEIFKRRYINEWYRDTCDELNIASSTYNYILSEIRGYALQCAAQAQVIKVF